MRTNNHQIPRSNFAILLPNSAVDTVNREPASPQPSFPATNFTTGRTVSEQFQGLFATYPPRSAHTTVFNHTQPPETTHPTSQLDPSQDFRIMRIESDVRSLKWDVIDIDRDVTQFASRLTTLEGQSTPLQSNSQNTPASDFDEDSDLRNDQEFRLMRIESDVRGLKWDVMDIIRELRKLDQRLKALEDSTTPQTPETESQTESELMEPALDIQLDFRIMRIEGDVRDLKWDVMDIERELSAFEQRLMVLEKNSR